MRSSSKIPPGLFSVPRLTTLTASLLAAFGSGTNYAYSAWAPQLGSRLHISHTNLNIIGSCGNFGMYVCGPITGRIVDRRGPRVLFVSAFIFLIVGYYGIRAVFDARLANIPLLVIFSFLTGAGGNAGFTSSVNATAKTFPDHARATATGIVISGFGLSAFLFSTLAHYVFPGDTSTFLLILSLGTSFSMLVAFFFVRPISLTHHPHYESVDSEPIVGHHFDNNSHTHLLGDTDEEPHLRHPTTPAEEYIPDAAASVELSPPRSVSRHLRSATRSTSHVREDHGHGPDVHGARLFISPDFWLSCLILTLLSGTGLMYINNVGSMSQALFAKGNPDYDEVEAEAWQAKQVSTISVMNFAGRIFIGIVSDFVKQRLELPRSFCCALVAFFSLSSQIMTANVDDVHDLWKASALLGLSHGCVFSLLPNVCIEWFGLSHFSENWGYISLSPILGGNLFSIAFGRILDSHGSGDDDGVCLEGKACYLDALKITMGATTLAILLSVLAGWRDWKGKIGGQRYTRLEDHDEGEI